MTHTRPAHAFWIRWLLAASLLVVVFGLALVLAPGLTRQGFSLLVYGSAARLDAFGPEPARYVSLTHAVIGGVMVGWGVALLYTTWALLRRGVRARAGPSSPCRWARGSCPTPRTRSCRASGRTPY